MTSRFELTVLICCEYAITMETGKVCRAALYIATFCVLLKLMPAVHPGLIVAVMVVMLATVPSEHFAGWAERMARKARKALKKEERKAAKAAKESDEVQASKEWVKDAAVDGATAVAGAVVTVGKATGKGIDAAGEWTGDAAIDAVRRVGSAKATTTWANASTARATEAVPTSPSSR